MTFDNFWSTGWGFIEHGAAGESQVSTSTFSSQIIPIIQFMVIIALTVLIIVILIIGIKYMLASATEKAELKKKLMGIVLATVIIASSYTIWSIVYNFMLKTTENMH